jgi:four helix bundle protein
MLDVRCTVYGSFLNYKTCFMDSEEMKNRTKQFAINVGVLTQGLPVSQINKAYSNQIIRSSSSVGANYRASRRAKSNADFINKLKIVEEELDESLFFLELLVFFNQPQKEVIGILYREGETLLKIIVASIISSRK